MVSMKLSRTAFTLGGAASPANPISGIAGTGAVSDHSTPHNDFHAKRW
jgi:hypothetical protein